MKNLIKRMYVEIFRWQRTMWYNDEIPAFTALLGISTLQFLNLLSLFEYFYLLAKINVFDYLSSHRIIGLAIAFSVLFFNYMALKPLKLTISEYQGKTRHYAIVYFLITIIFLVSSLVFIYMRDNR